METLYYPSPTDFIRFAVSEGLNSVETLIYYRFSFRFYFVSEGLNSVETSSEELSPPRSNLFQKDLIVWKLNCIEGLIFISVVFQKDLIVWKPLTLNQYYGT